jgi:hypothetical protein
VTVATYKDLKSLPIPKQAQILLCRLAKLHATSGNTFSSYNYSRQPEDLAHGFPRTEARAVTDLLLGAPWRWLENEGLIRQLGNNWHCITEAGYEAAKNPEPAFFAHREITSALPLLHPDFQGYAHYFHENKLKEAVAAAFERYENRLNEIRDNSSSTAAKAEAGRGLVYKLFSEKVLVRPYPKLGADPAAEQGLTGMLSGVLGWIRNPYTHEKHNLPDLKPSEALELLFVASYLMRMLELSKP